MKNKLTSSLLFWVVVAIILGFLCSRFFPDWLAGEPLVDIARTSSSSCACNCATISRSSAGSR